MTSRILLRRGTAAQWSSANPILGTGELGVETDTLKFKIGNGTSTWTQLTSYANITPSDLTSAINGLINAAPSALDTLNELAAAINNDSSFSTTVNNLLNGKVSKSGGDTITASSASTKGLIIRGAASQTANLTEWQDNTDIVKAYITSSGEVRSPLFGSTSTGKALLYTAASATGEFRIDTNVATNKGLVIRGSGFQTANLQEWQDSTGAVLNRINSAGHLVASSRSVFGGATSIVSGMIIAAVSQEATAVPILAKGSASQTADLQQFQNSAGSVLSRVQADGTFVWGSASSALQNSSGRLIINLGSAASVGVTVKGAASQTANLQEWQDSSGTVLASVNASGGVSIGPAVSGITSGQLRTSSDTGSNYVDTTANDNGFIGPGITGRRQRGTVDSPTAVQSNDLLYGFFGQGWNSSASFNPNAAAMRFIASQNLTSTANGAQIVLETTANNTTVRTERIRITNGGLFLIGSTTETLGSGGVASQLGVVATSATTVGAVIRGAASQTANLFETQDSAGTSLVRISASGVLITAAGKGVMSQYYTGLSSGAGAYIEMGSSTMTLATRVATNTIRVVGAASQSANLQEWQDSSGTILSKITASGVFGTNVIVNAQGTAPRITLNDASSTVLITAATNSTIGTVIKGAASQTADLQQWQDSAGAVLARVDQNGNIFTLNNLYVRNGGNDYGAAVNFGTGFNATKGFVLRGVASQTANLMEWQNSAATILTSVDASGNITAPSYNLSDSKYLLRKTIKKTVNPAGNAVANNTYDLFDMNFPSSLQGTFYIQASIRGPGYGQNLTYSLPATYAMDWINSYAITNPFTNNTTWVDLTPLTFSPRHLMINDYFKFQAKVSNNQISFRIKLTGTLTGSPLFDIYIQHSEEFANSTITELDTTGTDATTSNVMPNFLSSKAGLSAIFNPITLYSNSVSSIPLTVKGSTSQNSDLQQWQNSSGTTLARVTSSGYIYSNAYAFDDSNVLRSSSGKKMQFGSYWGIELIGSRQTSSWPTVVTGTSTDAGVSVLNSTASVVGLVVKGAASQTANLQEWQDSAGTVLTKVDSTGQITSTNGTQYGTIGSSGFQSGGASGITDIHYNGGNVTIRSGSAYSSNTSLLVGTGYAGGIGQIIKGYASQTANLTEWQNSAGTVLSYVTSSGSLRAPFLSDINGNGAFIQMNSNSSVTINTRNITNVGLVVSAQPSQTADLQQWQNSAGGSVARISAYGDLYIPDSRIALGSSSLLTNTFLFVNTSYPSYTPIVVRGAASQTANLQEWQNSSGTAMFSVQSDGSFKFSDSLSGPGTIYWGDANIGGFGGGAGLGNTWNFVPYNSSRVAVIVRGAASQTADLQQWQNSAGTVLTKVRASGQLNVGGAFAANTFGVANLDPTWVAAKVQGAASQTANLQEWQDSAGTVLSYVDASGSFTVPSLTVSGNFTVNGTTTNINTTNLVVEDKNITIADVATPTDTTADGAGITIKGATDKTFNWVNSTKSFTSSEDLIISKTLHPRLKIIDPTDGYTAGIDFITNFSGYPNTTSKILFDFFGTASIQTITGNAGHGMHYVSGRLNYGHHWFRKSTTDGVQMAILNSGNVGINSTSPTGTLQVNNLNSSTVGLIVRGVSSQTADLQQWQNSSSTVLGAVTSSGRIWASSMTVATSGAVTAGSQFGVVISSASTVGVGVKAAASQTADLQQWQDSSGTILAKVTASGGFELNGKDIEIMNIMGAF